ncbi:hypothetical protein VP01_1682g2 [Puccinia sorghi]|uniref:Uncharacterized protein n=1 Tax=Puccinia sorghi TaxID=27349 RepID=A0A0L6VG12_9BASI|nr:hypothetical protein VP01_1682g2 [Puccinia sorghi]
MAEKKKKRECHLLETFLMRKTWERNKYLIHLRNTYKYLNNCIIFFLHSGFQDDFMTSNHSFHFTYLIIWKNCNFTSFIMSYITFGSLYFNLIISLSYLLSLFLHWAGFVTFTNRDTCSFLNHGFFYSENNLRSLQIWSSSLNLKSKPILHRITCLTFQNIVVFITSNIEFPRAKLSQKYSLLPTLNGMILFHFMRRGFPLRMLIGSDHWSVMGFPLFEFLINQNFQYTLMLLEIALAWLKFSCVKHPILLMGVCEMDISKTVFQLAPMLIAAHSSHCSRWCCRISSFLTPMHFWRGEMLSHTPQVVVLDSCQDPLPTKTPLFLIPIGKPYQYKASACSDLSGVFPSKGGVAHCSTPALWAYLVSISMFSLTANGKPISY